MKNIAKMFAVLTMITTLATFAPAMLFAAEHGGTEMKEQGGASMEMAAPAAPEAPAAEAKSALTDADKVTVKEAADALRATNPDLAGKLDKIVS